MSIKLKKINKIVNEPGHWIKLNDAAQMLQVSEITLRRKLKSGKIKSEIREGKYYVFIKESEYKEKKNDLINFEQYLAEKELELRELRKQINDQKILIDALESQLNLLSRR